MSLGSTMVRTAAITLAVATLTFGTNTFAYAQESVKLVSVSNDDRSDEDDDRSDDKGNSWLDKAKEAYEVLTDNDSKCVEAELSYKQLDPATLEFTTSGERRDDEGDPICKGLDVLAAMYLYTGIEVSFPQDLAEVSEVLKIRTLGTFTVTIPNWPGDGCAQGNIYAEWVNGEEGLDPDSLNPTLENVDSDRPPFVHELLKGKGPSPTWVAAPPEGCNAPEPVTTTATTQVKSCEPGSENLILAEPAEGAIWSIEDNNGQSEDLAGIGEGYSGGLPDGYAYDVEYTISSRDGDDSDAFAATPSSQTWAPIESVDCNLYDASADANEDDPTNTKNSPVEFIIHNATWDSEPVLTVGKHERTATAIPPHLFPVEPSEENDWAKGVATWTVKYEIKKALKSAEGSTVGAASNDEESAASTTNEASPEGDGGLGGWIVAGIVATALLLWLIIWLYRRNKRKAEEEYEEGTIDDLFSGRGRVQPEPATATLTPNPDWIETQIMEAQEPQVVDITSFPSKSD